MNRSPAYQFYPDKWQSHTAHLSDTAYRVYSDVLDWMWMHSDDYCSIPSDPAFIAVILRRECNCIATALQEIQNPNMRLLKVRGARLVSGGLEKEAEKQMVRRERLSGNAKSGWDKRKQLMQPQCNCNALAKPLQCLPPPSSSSSSSSLTVTDKRESVGGEVGFVEKYPDTPHGRALKALHEQPELRGLTLEQLCTAHKCHPITLSDEHIETIKGDAVLAGEIKAPGTWLRTHFSMIDQPRAKRDSSGKPDAPKSKFT